MTHAISEAECGVRQGGVAGGWHPSQRLASSTAGAGWLNLLCLTLFGYALLGKGWAYVGIAPLYVGELTLLCGIAWFLRHGNWLQLDVPAVWLLLCLAAWGLLSTLPHLSTHGINALRDAVIWGYCGFAIIIFNCIVSQPSRLKLLIRRFGSFAEIYVWALPPVWFICLYFDEIIPCWPWSDSPIVHAKGGDVLVHYAGILAFWVIGFGRRAVGIRRATLMAATVAIVGVYNRGGLLTFLLVFAICFAVYPRRRMLWRFNAAATCGLLVLLATGLQMEMPDGKARVVSADQLISNVWSMAASSHKADLEGTKEWRLEWWKKIVDYTVSGPYFWMGKGFGINLADDDGFQGTAWEGRLRSPHNGHLTMLARAGVPGLVLWFTVHASWAWAIVTAYLVSRRQAEQAWSGLFLFLFLYWFALMVNASFDVYIESPMGGVWLWTIFGIGLAALSVHRYHPEVLRDEEEVLA